MISLDELRTRARAWAVMNTDDVRVDIDEDRPAEATEAPWLDAMQISVNDPNNEFAWVGFFISTSGQIFMTDASDDMDEDDLERLDERAYQLIAYLKQAM